MWNYVFSSIAGNVVARVLYRLMASSTSESNECLGFPLCLFTTVLYVKTPSTPIYDDIKNVYRQWGWNHENLAGRTISAHMIPPLRNDGKNNRIWKSFLTTSRNRILSLQDLTVQGESGWPFSMRARKVQLPNGKVDVDGFRTMWGRRNDSDNATHCQGILGTLFPRR